MHHEKGEYEIDHSLHVAEAHRGWLNDTRVDAVEQSNLPRTMLQASYHSRLDVYSDDTAGRADEAGQFERKETHAWTGFEHRYARVDVWGAEALRVLHEPPWRACENVTNPHPPQARCLARPARVRRPKVAGAVREFRHPD